MIPAQPLFDPAVLLRKNEAAGCNFLADTRSLMAFFVSWLS